MSFLSKAKSKAVSVDGPTEVPVLRLGAPWRAEAKCRLG